MDVLGESLSLFAVAALGILVGAILTEGLVLVPYWRSLETAAFYSWSEANDKRLVDFFGPLTWIAALSALFAAFASFWTAHAGRWYAVAAVAGMLVATSMFFVYFQRANASFPMQPCPPLSSARN